MCTCIYPFGKYTNETVARRQNLRPFLGSAVLNVWGWVFGTPVVSLGMERCLFCGDPVVDGKCPACEADLAVQFLRMQEAPIVPVSFEAWFPRWRPRTYGEQTILTARVQRAFVPDRLIISDQGGLFDVCLLVDRNEAPSSQVPLWVSSKFWGPTSFGQNLDIGTITPNDVLCLHVRWTSPPRPAWRLRLMAWLRALLRRSRSDDRPRFQALLMGRLVKSS